MLEASPKYAPDGALLIFVESVHVSGNAGDGTPSLRARQEVHDALIAGAEVGRGPGLTTP